MRRRGGLLLPPLERNVDDDDNNDAAASGTPAAIGTWAKAEAVDAAPAIFSDAGARTCPSGPSGPSVPMSSHVGLLV